MEACFPKFLTTAEILRALKERHLHIPNVEEKSFPELLNIYNSFLLPLAPRDTALRPERKCTELKKIDNEECPLLYGKACSAENSPLMQQNLLNKSCGDTRIDCTDTKSQQDKIYGQGTKNQSDQLNCSSNKSLINPCSLNKDALQQQSSLRKRHQNCRDSSCRNTLIPAKKRIIALHL